ncbi:hypothetical protein [Streptomyces aureoverticillatus]|uniref:hypothetical protein n=1 Tax=Streptomyces aureoverticillatus TaxID=66871 RepID=UPI0013DB73E1|nr:hypothetical protein [Streptomyces aureoverticillatus]QIB46923.1 hypothetical protein G3H79_31390 [Streptomyces aureoverticillatus]
MTETAGTYVHEAHGSVHSGEGPQFNIYMAAAAAATSRLREQTSRRPRTISKDDRIHLYQRFVDPPHFSRARETVRQTHTTLIDGLPGSGRRTAALMLLHELPDTQGSLHELPDTSDDEATSALDTQDVVPGDRLLLDLSEADESRYVAVQGELFGFRDHLSRLDAHLVVVLPHHLGYLLRDDLRHLTAELGRPSARRVLARHLRCENILPTSDELQDSTLATFLTSAPMRKLATLADGIRRQRDIGGTERGFAHWLAAALADEHDQSTRVAADISAEQNGRRRALLLSLAMFHGTTPVTVLHATNTLLKVLSHPQDDTPRLDRTDLYAEFGAIHAEVRADSRVCFPLPGYDSAVRDHFWTYMPDVRRQLRDWFQACMSAPDLAEAERGPAVARFGEQVLRCHRPEDLRWLVDRWTSSDTSTRHVPDAVQLLALGLADDQHGRYFRQQIYDWSKTPDTSHGLGQVLVLVCSEAMARTHPDQALVRLHHLARRARGRVLKDAREATLRLARSDNRLYRRMLDRLSTGMAQGQWGDSDNALFLALADPIRLIRSGNVRTLLARGWSETLRRLDQHWAGHVSNWLNACVTDTAHRTLVLNVLASACASDGRTSGRLYRAARIWQREDSGSAAERKDTVVHLLREIDARQGIESYGFAV